MADQLWLMTRIREEEEVAVRLTSHMLTIPGIDVAHLGWPISKLFS